jgi:sugar lactone lactonase YvrE
MTRVVRLFVAFSAALFVIGSGDALGQAQFKLGGMELLHHQPGGLFGGSIPDGTGGLLFSDFENNRINRIDLDTREVEVFDANSGGANGLRFDAEGRLVAMEMFAQRVTRRENGQSTVLADSFDGMSFNGPNGLVFDSQGGMYFTDLNIFAQVQTEGVYYLSQEGELSRIISDLHFPNGIGLSPDEQTLYVSTPTENPLDDEGEVWTYDVAIPGTVENKSLFASGFVDGLDVDAFGNVFGSSWDGVRAWDPNGDLIWSMPGRGVWHVTIHDSSATYPNTLYLSTYFGELFKVDLVPVPEPSSMVLLLTSFCFVTLRRTKLS